MGNIITTNDGANHILFDYDDFTDLIREQMGTEAERWLSDYIADMYGDAETIDAIVDEYEKELEQLRENYHKVMEELRAEAEKLAGLICEKDLDRSAISNTAGRIGKLTWREVNRR